MHEPNPSQPEQPHEDINTNVHFDAEDQPESEVQADLHFESETQSESLSAADVQKAKLLKQQRDIIFIQTTIARWQKVLVDAPAPGKEPINDKFVEELTEVCRTINVPQRDKLKRETKRTHIPVSKTMGDFKKKKQRIISERNRKKSRKRHDLGHMNEEAEDEEKLPNNYIWKNVLQHVPLDNIDSNEWVYVLSLNEEKLLLTLRNFFDEDQQKEFLEALEEAKRSWTCTECFKFDQKHARGDYIECANCNTWKVRRYTYIFFFFCKNLFTLRSLSNELARLKET